MHAAHPALIEAHTCTHAHSVSEKAGALLVKLLELDEVHVRITPVRTLYQHSTIVLRSHEHTAV